MAKRISKKHKGGQVMNDNSLFKDILLDKKNEFENYLYSYFNDGNSDYQTELFSAMNYSLEAGGKRLRPIILIESAKVFGASKDAALPFAAALEMIHTYSLIHDDLPAMDDDDLRRGKATNHVVYGEAKAILAGDALLNSAHTIMIEAAMNSNVSGFVSIENAIRAAYEISSKSGANGMIVGQIADIANENAQVDIDTLNYINNNKTGALIESAFASGAMIGGASETEIGKMRKVAQNIGLSFQIIDDILDIEGDTEIIGKPAGSDVKNEKTTYPSLIGLGASKEKAVELTEEAITILQELPYDTEFLVKLVNELLTRKL